MCVLFFLFCSYTRLTCFFVVVIILVLSEKLVPATLPLSLSEPLTTHSLTTFSKPSTRTAYREPLVYNLQVGREILKQVYRSEQMQPPSFSTVTSVYQTLWQRASSPAYWRGVLQSGEYKTIGVYALEAYGIFKVRCL